MLTNKHLLHILLMLSLLTVSCRRQALSNQVVGKASIVFMGTTEHDFGNFSKPDTLVHYFVYKNVGKVPFVINRVEASCHCVRPAYSKQPLPPGAVDSIKMTYDGDGYSPGYFIKSCDIYANTDTVYSLKIKGQCVPRK